MKMPIVKGVIQQRKENGELVSISFKAKAQEMQGSIEDVARVMLEAEMHGNDGKARIHLFLQ